MSVRNIKLNDYKSINESEEVSDKEFQKHLDDAMKRINDGEMPEDVFDVDGDWGSGCLRIKLDDKYNMLTWDRSTKQYNLLFDKWYDGMDKSFKWGWLGISKYDDEEGTRYNYINKEGEIFWYEWFTDIINGFNKNGTVLVEIDYYYVDVLTYDQGNLLSRGNNDHWRIDESYEINVYDEKEPWKSKKEWMYVVTNNSNDLLLVDNCPLEKNGSYVYFEKHEQNHIDGMDYFILRHDYDLIYDASNKKIVAPNEKIKNLEEHDELLIGDTDEGKIAIALNGDNSSDDPYVIIKGYKDIKIGNDYDVVICVSNDNKVSILNPYTLKNIYNAEFDELIDEGYGVLIVRIANRCHVYINAKDVDTKGFDYAKLIGSDSIYVKNNNLWNIIDDRGVLLSPTWSTTEPHWSDYNDAYVLTIDGKRAMLQYQGGYTYKLITENLNENLIDEEVSPEDVDLSSFAIKDELCPDFWEDGRFDQPARRTLLAIAKSFIEHLEIEDEVEDITVTGSIANYNWDENSSDIDLHILMDFDKLSDDPETLKKFFDAERKTWNKDHYEISIYGYPVEVYVQDINEEHHSSGIYSLLKDEWIKEPSKENLSDENTDYDHIQEITSSIMTVIDNLETDLDKDDPQTIYDDADTLFNNIKDIRKSGMGSDSPEMSDGNIIFKSLRRSGYMEKLIDIRTKAFDMIHSI